MAFEELNKKIEKDVQEEKEWKLVKDIFMHYFSIIFLLVALSWFILKFGPALMVQSFPVLLRYVIPIGGFVLLICFILIVIFKLRKKIRIANESNIDLWNPSFKKRLKNIYVAPFLLGFIGALIISILAGIIILIVSFIFVFFIMRKYKSKS